MNVNGYSRFFETSKLLIVDFAWFRVKPFPIILKISTMRIFAFVSPSILKKAFIAGISY
jgi:hypothetical protein